MNEGGGLGGGVGVGAVVGGHLVLRDSLLGSGERIEYGPPVELDADREPPARGD